jgi:2-polyprenyl-3-methyl-5-hydroxy-6-metoxy-1,4-benzoquinol methylase
MTMRTDLDEEKLPHTLLQLYRIKEGEMMSALVHLGSRLGLWSALDEHGPCDSFELAEVTGLQERWVREWLHGVSAADLVQHDDGAFLLQPEVGAVLATESHPSYMAGVFGPPMTHEEIELTAQAFRTGIGLTWDDHGDHGCHMQAAMGSAGQEAYLVPEIIASLDGVIDALRSGCRVVDVGCGAGVAACAIAAAFPESVVTGFDPSARAIEAAQRRAADRGLTNVEFGLGTFEALSDAGPVDFLLTLDVLHDLPHPEAAIAMAHAALAPSGTWLVADVRGRGDLEANRKIPVLPFMYAMSVFYCMSSSLSEPGGAGLGTLGLHRDVFETMATAAGFDHFEARDLDIDPTNRYYELRRG